MEHWNHKSVQQQQQQQHYRFQNPSFASSLLDQIYRSIDLNEHEPGLVQTMKKQTNYKRTTAFGGHELDLANFQRPCLIEKWMDHKNKLTNENIIIPKKSASAREFGRNSPQIPDSMLMNSTSSSSDSSCAGLFSESSSKSSGYYTNYHRPNKPIRTSFSTQPERFNDQKIKIHLVLHRPTQYHIFV